MVKICHDYGDPNIPTCAKYADEHYTIRFDDIGEKPLYWCTVCGPGAQIMHRAITRALATRGPEFAKELETAINEKMYNS